MTGEIEEPIYSGNQLLCVITLADTVRVIWTAENKWNQIVAAIPNKNV
jgi:hypothetical protein